MKHNHIFKNTFAVLLLIAAMAAGQNARSQEHPWGEGNDGPAEHPYVINFANENHQITPPRLRR